jgi:hypothetical protein
MERRAPEKPDFEPDVITLLDFLSKWIRRKFFGRVVTGGWRYRLLACCVFAYLYPY